MQLRDRSKYEYLSQLPTKIDAPDKVFVYDKHNRGAVEGLDGWQDAYWSEDGPFAGGIRGLLSGYYGAQNYMALYECLPELFAPVNEIASRIADTRWQLRRYSDDEIVWDNEDFNRLFTRPNPLQSMQEFVKQAVVYEILTGKQFFYLNRPSGLWNDPSNILSWSNLPSQHVKIEVKERVDPYKISSVEEYIKAYTLKASANVTGFRGGNYAVDQVIPIINISMDGLDKINDCRSHLAGAEMAIKNLIPVYQARGMIYIKRGALGFIVSDKSDMSGKVALPKSAREQIRAEYERTYGIIGGKSPVGIIDQPVNFIRTGMSIQELQPFEETRSAAIAIARCVRLPMHLALKTDQSTYNNADADYVDLYGSTVEPWAQKLGDIWTQAMGWAEDGYYIKASYDHLDILQKKKKEKADQERMEGETWLQRFNNGQCSLNEWIKSWGGVPVDSDLYNKKLFELDETQRNIIKQALATEQKSKVSANILREPQS